MIIAFRQPSRQALLVLVPAFGNVQLAGITRSSVKNLVAQLRAEGKADATIRNTLVPLREMLGHAVEDGQLPSNPAGIKIVQSRKRKVVPPSRDTVERLLKHARDEARDAILVATSSGLRRGGLFALTWGDVTSTRAHDPRPRLQLAAAPWRRRRRPRRGRGTCRCSSRPGSRWSHGSSLPLRPLAGLRLRHRGRYATRPRELRPQGVQVGVAPRWATGSSSGTPFRHYAVSELIAQGADIKLIQAFAGHASATMTLDIRTFDDCTGARGY